MGFSGARGSSPVWALILAGGASRRMGAANKLLAPLAGEALVRHAVREALASACDEVLVVLGHDADAVRQALADLPVRFVVGTDYAEGMGASLRAGAAVVPDDASVIVCLGDMPAVRAWVLDALIAAYRTNGQALACQPVHAGRPGNPVLWDASCLPALRALRGDAGARAILRELGEGLCLVPVDCPGVLDDIDTPEDLLRHTGQGPDVVEFKL